MFEKRQDVICRMAVVGAGRPGKAAARLTLTEQTPVRVIGRVERKLLAPALAGGITPSPGTGFDAGDGFASTEASTFTPEPETHGIAIPALAARGASRADPQATRSGASAKADSRPRIVTGRDGVRELRLASRKDRATAKKSLRNNRLRQYFGGADPAFRTPDYSR